MKDLYPKSEPPRKQIDRLALQTFCPSFLNHDRCYIGATTTVYQQSQRSDRFRGVWGTEGGERAGEMGVGGNEQLSHSGTTAPPHRQAQWIGRVESDVESAPRDTHPSIPNDHRCLGARTRPSPTPVVCSSWRATPSADARQCPRLLPSMHGLLHVASESS